MTTKKTPEVFGSLVLDILKTFMLCTPFFLSVREFKEYFAYGARSNYETVVMLLIFFPVACLALFACSWLFNRLLYYLTEACRRRACRDTSPETPGAKDE